MADPETPAKRGPRRPVDRYDARRDELALSALATLGTRGYANTSVRDIASNSAYSHGVLHYYFTDKTELITHGVRLYKAECVTRYDDVVALASSEDDLVDRFSTKLASTLVEDVAMHRLWYDLRTQAMFELAFRETVRAIDTSLEQMIWRVLQRYAELSGRAIALAPATAYALIDGLFEQGLRDHVGGDPDAPGALTERVRAVLPLLLA